MPRKKKKTTLADIDMKMAITMEEVKNGMLEIAELTSLITEKYENLCKKIDDANIEIDKMWDDVLSKEDKK